MSDPTTTLAPPGQESQPATQQVKEQAKEQAQRVAGQASEQARNLAGQARSQVDERSTAAGQKATEHASDLRSVAEHLRSQGKDQPAKLAEQAAERVERAGSWLTEADADTILREVEDFGRRRPWAVIGAGIALGVAASRMLKASSEHRYRSGSGSMTTPQPRGLPQNTTAYETPPTTPRSGDGTWSGGSF